MANDSPDEQRLCDGGVVDDPSPLPVDLVVSESAFSELSRRQIFAGSDWEREKVTIIAFDSSSITDA